MVSAKGMAGEYKKTVLKLMYVWCMCIIGSYMTGYDQGAL